VATRRSGRTADGVWLVELAALTDPAEVAPAVLATFAHRDGHREGTTLSASAAVAELATVAITSS
jgi:predicted ATPase